MFPDFPDLHGTEKRSIVVLKSVNLVTVTEIPNLKLQKSAEAEYTFRAVGHFSIPFQVPARLKGRSYTENRAASREQVAS